MPRSASRDVVDRFNTDSGGRLRYFQKWNRLERRKMLLSLVALMGVVGWLGASWLTKTFDYQSTHGPLTASHAKWDRDCEQCHRTDNKDLLDASAKWQTNIETCGRCHGAAVHSEKIWSDDSSGNCGSCHHDHNGREFSLVKLNDNHCVRCHGDLKANMKGDTKCRNEITSFANHPTFLDKPRPSNFKFSHAQHMTPGMVLTEGGKGGLMKDGKVVQLQCADCHQLDSAGAYYKPINYQNHCASCHPTTVPPFVTQNRKAIPSFAVPHGLWFSPLVDVIEGEYARRIRLEMPSIDNRTFPEIRQHADYKPYQDEIWKAVNAGLESLDRNQCMKCHNEGGYVDLSENNRPLARRNNPAYPHIPERWLPHAKFNHSAHHAMKCDDCHLGTGAAYKTPERAEKWEREEPHFLDNAKASCAECHSKKGGLRHACTDCHSYHHGDSAPITKLTIEQFLKGR